MDKSGGDAQLFRELMQDVRRLQCDRIPPAAPQPKPVPRQRYREEAQIHHDMLSEAFDPAELETGEELVYLRPGMQQSVLRKLRRGQYSVMAELDLHGFVVREARAEVSAFLHECQLRYITCVRIIHGKGYGSHQKQPVLKHKLNHWLQQIDAVLAFSSARSADGGTGAVYVLLKRR